MMRLFLLSLIVSSQLISIPRNEHEVEKFKQMTGFPKGRPGFVVDHKIPLCAGGPDDTSNMQWEEVRESYVKDKYERALCRYMKEEGYILVKANGK